MFDRRLRACAVVVWLTTLPLIGAAGATLFANGGPVQHEPGMRAASDDELDRVVGFCPRCCKDLGLCNALDEQPCPEDDTGQCVQFQKICTQCTPVDHVDVCLTWYALPGNTCTAVGVPCNPAQANRQCLHTGSGCLCMSAGGTVPCGQSANCTVGSSACP